MSNWSALKASIDAIVKANGNQEINGTNMNQVLDSIIDNLGELSMYNGNANTATVPGSPDGRVFYLASEVGDYSNFGVTIPTLGVWSIDNNSGSWGVKLILDLDSDFGVQENQILKLHNDGYSYLGYAFENTPTPGTNAIDRVYIAGEDGTIY
jgi:hypothetical protein